jgi:hypothetical protein
MQGSPGIAVGCSRHAFGTGADWGAELSVAPLLVIGLFRSPTLVVLAFMCNVQSLRDDLIHSAWATSHPVLAAKLVSQLAVCGVTGVHSR